MVSVISLVGNERLTPGPASLNAGPRDRAQAAETGPVTNIHPGPSWATCQAVIEPAKGAKTVTDPRPALFITTDKQIPTGSAREAGVIELVLGRRADSLRGPIWSGL
jgi:hypothetical protein